ncbi:MAG: response regulator [Verrucomicrobiota bacterium]|nr:response regulator [Verrucomicrobiota bacterium]
MTPAKVIAIVDDNESVGRALRRILRSLPAEVRVFTSAGEFLKAFGDRDPSVLILDLQMPEMDGLQLQQHLRNENREVPIIFITARDDEELRKQAIGGGALGFLTKPFDKKAVLSLVADALKQTESRKSQLRLVGRLTSGLVKLVRPQLAHEDLDFALGDMLPCPFCGSHPRSDKGTNIDLRGRARHYARVVCPRCGAMISTDRDEEFASAAAAEAEIRRRWNRRA